MSKIGEHESELSRSFDSKAFERSFADFLNKADANAVSGKANGGQTPFGYTRKPKYDGADISTHFGQGAASRTPYLNWWVVSIYYLPENGNIALGIEEDRYPHLKEMQIKPLRFSQLGNKKVNTAVFYSTNRENLDYSKLYECFLNVCEEVMRLGLR